MWKLCTAAYCISTTLGITSELASQKDSIPPHERNSRVGTLRDGTSTSDRSFRDPWTPTGMFRTRQSRISPQQTCRSAVRGARVNLREAEFYGRTLLISHANMAKTESCIYLLSHIETFYHPDGFSFDRRERSEARNMTVSGGRRKRKFSRAHFGLPLDVKTESKRSA